MIEDYDATTCAQPKRETILRIRLKRGKWRGNRTERRVLSAKVETDLFVCFSVEKRKTSAV